MRIQEAIAVIRDSYETEHGTALLSAARDNEPAAIRLAETLLAETDENGELRHGILSAHKIAETESALT